MKYTKIAMGDIPDVVELWKDLRGDQKYLYRMVLAIHDGKCDEKLASAKPGPVSTARWLTTAARILRLYVSKKNPSKELIKLVQFIVKVYAPFWFLVMTRPQAIHGSRNVHQYITWLRKLPKDAQDVKNIVHESIGNSAYFFHPENILLSMITDSDFFIRRRAFSKILELRQDPPPTIRPFNPTIFKLNFESLTYITMVDWKHFTTEPPCLQFFTQDQLQAFQHDRNNIIEIPGNLIHCK